MFVVYSLRNLLRQDLGLIRLSFSEQRCPEWSRLGFCPMKDSLLPAGRDEAVRKSGAAVQLVLLRAIDELAGLFDTASERIDEVPYGHVKLAPAGNASKLEDLHSKECLPLALVSSSDHIVATVHPDGGLPGCVLSQPVS